MPSSTAPELHIDAAQRTVEWQVWRSTPQRSLYFAWGTLKRLDETGQGIVVTVRANASFTLIMHLPHMTFVEPVTPGTHHFVLTHLDRNNVNLEAGDNWGADL